MEMSDPLEYCGNVCCECEHCFYTGLPGAYACELKKFPAFVDPMGTCENYEQMNHEENEQIYMKEDDEVTNEDA